MVFCFVSDIKGITDPATYYYFATIPDNFKPATTFYFQISGTNSGYKNYLINLYPARVSEYNTNSMIIYKYTNITHSGADNTRGSLIYYM